MVLSNNLKLLYIGGNGSHLLEINKANQKILRDVQINLFSECNSQVYTCLEVFNHKYLVIRPLHEFVIMNDH